MLREQSTQPVLNIERLSRQVGDVKLVDDISLVVHRGQIVAITGPSGSGKSSFLRLLNRLDEPTGGTVFLDGKDYRQIPPRELRQKVGMVMQTPHLFPGTVRENICYGPRQRGFSLPAGQVENLLEEVGLAGYADRDVHNLSGGEAQRVSVARTLANQPQVLLLDEPTSALDETSRQDVEDLLVHIFQSQGLTCLIVTHDMDQARRMGTHAVLLRSGRLVSFGPVEEVLHA